MTTHVRAATVRRPRLRVRSSTLVAVLLGSTALAACGRARAMPDVTPGVKPNVQVRYPRDASRFAAEPLSDSTLSFAAVDAPWVRTGMLGIAVDPTRGDALVARLRVTSVRDGRVQALVTGQTTRVANGHVVLLVAPKVAWWRQRLYWVGALSGSLVAGSLALLLM